MRTTITRIGAVGAGTVLALGLLAGPPAGASSDHGPKADKTEKAEKAEKRGRADNTEKVEKVEKVERATCLTTEGHTQGRSQSDPDGMSNGGPDKPGCTGGFDDDRDGNNGCGNDADREDDNNGRCGKGTSPDLDVAPNVDVDADDLTDCDIDGKEDVDSKEAEACVDSDAETDGSDASVQGASTGTTETGTLAGDTSVNGASTTGADVAATSAQADTTTEPTTEVLGETLERSPSVLARTGAGVGTLALLGGLLCGGGRLALLARRFLHIG